MQFLALVLSYSQLKPLQERALGPGVSSGQGRGYMLCLHCVISHSYSQPHPLPLYFSFAAFKMQ